MNFALTGEQELVVRTVREFVERELYPLEREVERTGELPREIARDIQDKVLSIGFYAPNIPAEYGGGGLDNVTFALLERELGRASMALNHWWYRPSNILCAANDEQRERYLLPCVRGERIDALAMTEPDAGSDVRGMKCFAKRDGDDFIVNGTKHFISHADVADFVIAFIATGEESRGRKRITCFLVDRGTPGFEIRKGYNSVSHRGYHNCILTFDDCRLPSSQILGEEGQGFETANTWLYATRITVATMCVGRARRVFDIALNYAAQRKQFGQQIGKFQGVGFKLADMITSIDAADLLTLSAAWRLDQGFPANREISQAKLFATEMLARVTDEAIQVHGGMGLMDDLPLERFWRDARVERIWDGTSEIQRHIISRDLLRPLVRDLSRLFRPRSIAVVGGKPAAEVVRQNLRIGYAGKLWPVHPSSKSIEGLQVFRTLRELPEPPDAVFLAVNRHLTIECVRDLAAMGAGGVVSYASGFAEHGAEGEALQAALREAAGDMPVLGPNCYGLINYVDGALLWPDQHGGARVPRGVAIVTQSGNIGCNITMQRRGLPISYLCTMGNQAVVGLSAALETLANDERVTAIGLHVEGIDDAEAFARAAAVARACKKPLVALKTGDSAAGAALTVTHTASLAGAGGVVDAFLRRVGVARVASIPVLLETLKLLHMFGPLPGGEIASMSCSGGEAALIADRAEGRRIRFRPLDARQKAEVRATLSELVTVSNPLDYHTFSWANPEALTRTFAAMMRQQFALTALILDFPRTDRCDEGDWLAASDALIEASRATGARAAVIATLPECLPEARATHLMAAGIVPLLDIDDALAAIEAAIELPAASPPIVTRISAGHAVTLDEVRSKRALAEHGVVVPAARLARTPEEAADAAQALGFPVVLKAVGAALAHKSEAGAVRLDLRDRDSVQAAAAALILIGDSLLVECMVTDAVAEVIVGFSRDPAIGPYLVLGSGGVLVELIGDSAILLLPASEQEIRGAIGSLKVKKMLDGHRGKPAGDIGALVQTVLAVQGYALANIGTLLELDVNPVMVRPAGRGAVAVDALIRLAREPA